MKINFLKITSVTLCFYLLSNLINISFSVKLNSRKDVPTPLVMNVTYQNPLNDYDERKHYLDEERYLKKRIDEIEEKIEADSELLKMIFNVNNVQIQKLSEVVNVNLASLYYKALSFMPKPPKAKPKSNDDLHLDVSKIESVEHFMKKAMQRGLIDPSASHLLPSKTVAGYMTDPQSALNHDKEIHQTYEGDPNLRSVIEQHDKSEYIKDLKEKDNHVVYDEWYSKNYPLTN